MIKINKQQNFKNIINQLISHVNNIIFNKDKTKQQRYETILYNYNLKRLKLNEIKILINNRYIFYSDLKYKYKMINYPIDINYNELKISDIYENHYHIIEINDIVFVNDGLKIGIYSKNYMKAIQKDIKIDNKIDIKKDKIENKDNENNDNSLLLWLK